MEIFTPGRVGSRRQTAVKISSLSPAEDSRRARACVRERETLRVKNSFQDSIIVNTCVAFSLFERNPGEIRCTENTILNRSESNALGFGS